MNNVDVFACPAMLCRGIWDEGCGLYEESDMV